jgi:hypothetical protein
VSVFVEFTAKIFQITFLKFGDVCFGLTQHWILVRLYSIYYIIYKKSIIWKLPQKKKVFVFVVTDHLRIKIIINDEILAQVNQFTYLGCSISYQFSNDVEFKLAKFLQLIGTVPLRELFSGKWERKLFLKYTTLKFYLHFYMCQKTGLWQPHRDVELKRQKWNYWELWQATPFMTTKQTTPYAVNYTFHAY